jgi:protein-disulfide isomerase
MSFGVILCMASYAAAGPGLTEGDDPAMMLDMTSGHPPSLGPASAAVTIVEFADFQCSYCSRLAIDLERAIASEHDVRLIYRSIPARRHSWAKTAAEIEKCVAVQNLTAFWDLHDFFYSNPSSLNDESVYRISVERLSKGSFNVDKDLLTVCLSSNSGAAEVQHDIELGRKYGVAFTPTLFVNGVRYVGAIDPTRLAEVIERAKKDVQNLGAEGGPGRRSDSAKSPDETACYVVEGKGTSCRHE